MYSIEKTGSPAVPKLFNPQGRRRGEEEEEEEEEAETTSADERSSPTKNHTHGRLVLVLFPKPDAMEIGC